MDSLRWRQFPLKVQMGHIAAEVGRALFWEKKEDWESRKNALIRALELIDLTMSSISGLSRRREIARLREAVGGCLIRSSIYGVTLTDLDRYFLPFCASS